ncbi:MAG: gamma-glutamylcyclotransferase family protein, partial [Thermoproteota archaeon]
LVAVAALPLGPYAPGYELLFVYGEERMGCSGHAMLRGAVRLGEAILSGFTVTRGERAVAARCRDGGSCKVRGELYLVPASLLRLLDAVKSGYARRERVVVTASGNVELEAWAYVSGGEVEGPKMEEGSC